MVKKLLLSHFNEPQRLIPCDLYVDALVGAVKFGGCGDDLLQFLRDGRPFAQVIDDLAEHDQALLLVVRASGAQIIPPREANESILVYLKCLVDV